MKVKTKFKKRNNKSIGKRRTKLEQLEREELDNIQAEYNTTNRTEIEDEKE